MQWGPTEREPFDENGYLRELAAFLSARSGGGPALLWTDYEPPAADGPFDADRVTGLADRLGALLGRAVRAVPGGPDDPSAAQVRQDDAETLVLQHSSALDVLVGTSLEGPVEGSAGRPVGRPARSRHAPLTVRLLAGQAVFLPRRSRYSLRPEPGSRHTVLQISTTTTCDDTGAPRRTGCEPALN
ncbi:hypothetical protein GCM10009760_21790 [Kitasatospora kazusensis]|uniref:Uncharacterized protein n=1 Tax=Kitasatospora kazusensis TaxID=407974 RepID=A0ABN2ZAV4_9ACTN